MQFRHLIGTAALSLATAALAGAAGCANTNGDAKESRAESTQEAVVAQTCAVFGSYVSNGVTVWVVQTSTGYLYAIPSGTAQTVCGIFDNAVSNGAINGIKVLFSPPVGQTVTTIGGGTVTVGPTMKPVLPTPPTVPGGGIGGSGLSCGTVGMAFAMVLSCPSQLGDSWYYTPEEQCGKIAWYYQHGCDRTGGEGLWDLLWGQTRPDGLVDDGVDPQTLLDALRMCAQMLPNAAWLAPYKDTSPTGPSAPVCKPVPPKPPTSTSTTTTNTTAASTTTSTTSTTTSTTTTADYPSMSTTSSSTTTTYSTSTN